MAMMGYDRWNPHEVDSAVQEIAKALPVLLQRPKPPAEGLKPQQRDSPERPEGRTLLDVAVSKFDNGITLLRDSKGSKEQVNGSRRVAFVSVPLEGHRRMAVALAEEMCRRGYQVDFLIDASGVNEKLQKMDSEFSLFTLHAVGGETFIQHMDWGYVASSTGRLGGSKVALMEAIAKCKDQLPAAVAQWKLMKEILASLRPDAVLFDHSQALLQLWAEEQHIPSVILHTPYFVTGAPAGCARLSFWETFKLLWAVKRTNAFEFMELGKRELEIGSKKTMDSKLGEGAAGAGARGVSGFAPHTMVFCEPELLGSESVPARVHVVGPCFSAGSGAVADERLRPWLAEASRQGDRVLYVALGTLANGFLTAAAVGCLLDAFYSLGAGWRVLWSLPRAQQPLLEASGRQRDGARVRVEGYVAQRGVLAHPAVRLFLTHGGQSSVNEGLAAGLPLLCMPLFCDQYEMAQALSDHGLGLLFHKDELLAGDHQRLAKLAHQALEDPRFRENAERHAQLIRLRAGCGRAAEVVESIVHAGVDYKELWQGTPPKAEAGSGACLAGLASFFSRR